MATSSLFLLMRSSGKAGGASATIIKRLSDVGARALRRMVSMVHLYRLLADGELSVPDQMRSTRLSEHPPRTADTVAKYLAVT
jgi:hypothetical protein